MTTLITESYRAEQRALHEKFDYGTASIGFAPAVAKVMNQYKVTDLLDYGAGRLNLIKTISEKRLVDHKFSYRAYEPANDKYADIPDPAEMVACIDVLEHVEPELLDEVLDDLERLTTKIGFFSIHCGPAAKVLSDGRNAHLIQEGPEWWLPQIMSRFELQTFQRVQGGFFVLVSAR